MRKYLLVLLCLIVGWGSTGAAAPTPSAPRYRPLIQIERGYVMAHLAFPEKHSFSPDGTRIAAAATETTVNIWDIQTGQVMQTFAYEGLSAPLSVSWSPDGTLIATGAKANELRVWDTASGDLQYAFGLDSAFSVAWSPDSTRFVTEYRNVYDSRSGVLLFHDNSPYFEGCQAYWSPDGAMIATTTCYEGDYLTIWSVEDGTLIDTYWGGRAASWSPDSTRIASTGQVREIATGLPVTIIPAMGGDIAWHPTEEWIASTGDGHQVSLWDAKTGELLTAWVHAGCEITAFAWSSDGNRFAANCLQYEPRFRNDLIIWELVS